MDNFNKLCEDLRKQKQVLQAQYDEARSSAISHVQQIITDFRIKASDLKFSDEPQRHTTRIPIVGDNSPSWWANVPISSNLVRCTGTYAFSTDLVQVGIDKVVSWRWVNPLVFSRESWPTYPKLTNSRDTSGAFLNARNPKLVVVSILLHIGPEVLAADGSFFAKKPRHYPKSMRCGVFPSSSINPATSIWTVALDSCPGLSLIPLKQGLR